MDSPAFWGLVTNAMSIVRPWAFIKGGRLIGPYRETHTVHLVYFNICTDMIVQFNSNTSIFVSIHICIYRYTLCIWDWNLSF